MQSRTTFLSKLIGWYCVLFALCMFLNKQFMVAAVSALIQEAPLALVMGVVILGAGIAMVLSHNVWSGGVLPVVVTVLGWATLIKGLIMLFLSPSALEAYYVGLRYADLFYVYAAVTFIIGAYLLVAGYRSRTF